MNEERKPRWQVDVPPGTELTALGLMIGALAEALAEALRHQPRQEVLRIRQVAIDTVKRSAASAISHETEVAAMNAAIGLIMAIMPDDRT